MLSNPTSYWENSLLFFCPPSLRPPIRWIGDSRFFLKIVIQERTSSSFFSLLSSPSLAPPVRYSGWRYPFLPEDCDLKRTLSFVLLRIRSPIPIDCWFSFLSGDCDSEKGTLSSHFRPYWPTKRAWKKHTNMRNSSPHQAPLKKTWNPIRTSPPRPLKNSITSGPIEKTSLPDSDGTPFFARSWDIDRPYQALSKTRFSPDLTKKKKKKTSLRGSGPENPFPSVLGSSDPGKFIFIRFSFGERPYQTPAKNVFLRPPQQGRPRKALKKTFSSVPVKSRYSSDFFDYYKRNNLDGNQTS